MLKTVPMIAISKSTRALHLRAVLDIHCSVRVRSTVYIPQATERECVCCRELEDVLSIFSQESVRLTCIVDHPEFATVCLKLASASCRFSWNRGNDRGKNSVASS